MVNHEIKATLLIQGPGMSGIVVEMPANAALTVFERLADAKVLSGGTLSLSVQVTVLEEKHASF